MKPLLPMAGSRSASLPTFRRSGEPVSTPVRIVRTPAGTGKVERLRGRRRTERIALLIT